MSRKYWRRPIWKNFSPAQPNPAQPSPAQPSPASCSVWCNSWHWRRPTLWQVTGLKKGDQIGQTGPRDGTTRRDAISIPTGVSTWVGIRPVRTHNVAIPLNYFCQVEGDSPLLIDCSAFILQIDPLNKKWIYGGLVRMFPEGKVRWKLHYFGYDIF